MTKTLAMLKMRSLKRLSHLIKGKQPAPAPAPTGTISPEPEAKRNSIIEQHLRNAQRNGNEGSVQRDGKRAHLSLLPVELLLEIVSFLDYSDRFALKLTGDRFIAEVIRNIPRPTFDALLTELKIMYTQPYSSLNAVITGRLSLVDRILKTWTTLEDFRTQLRRDWKCFALQQAITHKQSAVVHYLLANEPDIAPASGTVVRYGWIYPMIYLEKNCPPMNALELAVKYNAEEQGLLLLKRFHGQKDGFGINNGSPFQTRGWMRVLHVAALVGNDIWVKMLLELGADVNYYCDCFASRKTHSLVEKAHNKSSTALHYAAKGGHLGILKLLLAAGAHVNIQDEQGGTPLHSACEAGQLNSVALLINHNAELNKVDNNKQTSLYLATRYSHEGVVRLLIQRGADSGIRNKDNRTPLFEAIRNGLLTTVTLMTSSSCKATMEDLEASLEGNPDMFKAGSKLVDNYVKITRLLLDKFDQDYDQTCRDLFSKAAAATWGGACISMLLADQKWNAVSRDEVIIPALTTAIQNDNSLQMKMLVEEIRKRHPSRNDRLLHLNQALIDAVKANSISSIEYLHMRGADLETRIKARLDEKDGSFTLLQYAAATDAPLTVDCLLKLGANIDARDEDGGTVLHHAARGADWYILSSILKTKPKPLVDIRDRNWRTPLMAAVLKCNYQAARVLLENGAWPSAEDIDGKPIEHIAKPWPNKRTYGGRQVMWNILEKYGASTEGIEYCESVYFLSTE